MKFKVFGLMIILASQVYGQIDHNKVAEFARSYADRHETSLEEINVILNNAKFQESIVTKMDKPAEGTMNWTRYRKIFLTPDRISKGVEFWNENEALLQNVSKDSGIPAEIIIGILGVETFYGQRIGSYRVLDALYTLAFAYPKRASFFKAELEKFFELAIKENLDIYQIKGSYAGAIGYCQFMPSSYLAYAKSYSGGDSRDLMQKDDAIASVANYLKVHRWSTGEPIVTEVSQLRNPQNLESGVRPNNTLRYYSDNGYIPKGNISPNMKSVLVRLETDDTDEFWLGFNNFYVITRYNHSAMYAMAVYQLAEAIKEQRLQQ